VSDSERSMKLLPAAPITSPRSSSSFDSRSPITVPSVLLAKIASQYRLSARRVSSPFRSSERVESFHATSAMISAANTTTALIG
jgi:hypothetical protein